MNVYSDLSLVSAWQRLVVAAPHVALREPWVMLVRVISPEELARLVRDLPPPRDDDVTVLADGARLDTSEKLLAYINEQQIRDGLPLLRSLD